MQAQHDHVLAWQVRTPLLNVLSMHAAPEAAMPLAEVLSAVYCILQWGLPL